MPEDTFDEWSTSSGLIDDVDVTITNAVFTNPSDYMDGQVVVLLLEGQTSDSDNPEFSQYYSCGNGWEAAERGASVRREDGKRKPFNKSSSYGIFFTRAVELEGAGEVLKGKGTPFQAGTWIGTKWHLNRTTIQGSGEIKDREILLPTAFLGVTGQSTAPANTGTTGPVSTPASESPPQDHVPTNGELSLPLKAKLKALARQCTTHEEFIEKAYTDSSLEVNGNAAAEQAVIETTPGSIWAEVHG